MKRDKMIQLVETLWKEECREGLNQQKIDKIIIQICGLDPRTRQNWINALFSFGYMEKTGDSYSLTGKALELDLHINVSQTLETYTHTKTVFKS